MIHDLHYLMAMHTPGGVSFAAKRAQAEEAAGLRLYFPSGHQTKVEKVSFWIDTLSRHPIPWLSPTTHDWTIDIDGAKATFLENIGRLYADEKEGRWPEWLVGPITLEPEFEIGTGFKPRLAFLLTRELLARARSERAARQAQGVVIQVYSKEFRMGDEYKVSGGQIGVVGAHSKATGNEFTQVWNHVAGGLDVVALANELSLLRAAMRKNAVEVEHDQAIASVGAAELAAKKGDAGGALQHLKSAGLWALEAAAKIGTGIAAKAIEQALKL